MTSYYFSSTSTSYKSYKNITELDSCDCFFVEKKTIMPNYGELLIPDLVFVYSRMMNESNKSYFKYYTHYKSSIPSGSKLSKNNMNRTQMH